jgi:hypothetical protein
VFAVPQGTAEPRLGITVLDDERFGFRTKSSTMAATFNLINEIIDAFNSKKQLVVYFATLKRFSTVLTTIFYCQN